MNEFLELLRVLGCKNCWKINGKKTKSLRLAMSEGETVMLSSIKWIASLS